MNSEDNFETYLYVSNEKFSILVKKKNSDKTLYENNFILNEKKIKNSYDLLDQFLNTHIFKIENLLKNFIKNVNLIINSDDNLKIDISVKKVNYGEKFNKETLNHLLIDAKNQINENYHNKIIGHIIIDKYSVDNQQYSSLPTDTDDKKCENISIDINFICFSKDFIKNFEKILSKYQIQINNLVCANYIKRYFKEDFTNIFSSSQKILSGHNVNEVILVPKTQKIQGFFEKFFNFFS
tara:strand:+ start:844 stop:1557 length:714 start_codon:yes stop_codon:yes gene_type:complete